MRTELNKYLVNGTDSINSAIKKIEENKEGFVVVIENNKLLVWPLTEILEDFY